MYEKIRPNNIPSALQSTDGALAVPYVPLFSVDAEHIATPVNAGLVVHPTGYAWFDEFEDEDYFILETQEGVYPLLPVKGSTGGWVSLSSGSSGKKTTIIAGSIIVLVLAALVKKIF